MEEVLAFWFSHPDRWWSKNAAFDDEVRRRFGPLRDEVLAGAHDAWRSSPRGALAYVVVLDQFSRNLFRDDARAYEADPLALAASREALTRGDDAHLAPDERAFLYMPFMHSEALADQERGVDLFRALGNDENLRFAELHREVIRRFGRFPHRNRVLGRASTEEEIAFLKQPGSSFA